MIENKINLTNFGEFFQTIEKKTKLEKNPYFKKLKLSKISFFIYRYLVKSYVFEGIHTFATSSVLKDIVESNIFCSTLTNKEKDFFELISSEEELSNEEFEKLSKEEQQAYVIDNNDITNYPDRLENELNTNLKLIEYISELSDKGFIICDLDLSQKKDIFNYFSTSFSLSVGGLNLINDDLNLKVEIEQLKKGYTSYKDYLSDAFIYMNSKQSYIIQKESLNPESPIVLSIKKQMEEEYKILEKNIDKTKITIPFIEFCKENEFSKEQEDIILSLLKEDLETKTGFGLQDNLMRLYYKDNEFVNYNKIFDFEEGIIEVDFVDSYNNIYIEDRVSYTLSDEVFERLNLESENEAIHKSKDKNKIKQLKSIVSSNSNFELIEPEQKLEDLVLSDKTNEAIEVLLKSLDDNVIEKLKKWNFDMTLNSCILFSGFSGTGKTASAHAIAHSLNKHILSFDCSQILSMYVGESEKNVKNIFETYTKVANETDNPPILLLNEADQFLSSRIEKTGSGSDNMHNQMQNIFLEQIEKFQGILIATTNLKKNLDKAFSRRFNKKIEFKIPEKKHRIKIWKIKIENKLPLVENFDFDKVAQSELSGGQIDLIIKNTVLRLAVKDAEEFREQDFIDSIEEELGQKFDKDSKVGFF